MSQALSSVMTLAPLGFLAMVILVVPGLLILRPIGAPLPVAAVLAPAVGLLLLSVTGFVLAGLGVSWNFMSVSVVMIVTFAISSLLGRRFRFVIRSGLDGSSWLFRTGLAAALVGSSVTTMVALFRGMGSLDTASQGWDPIFHMNAVQWIRESGEATPWSVSPIFASHNSYYPVGWHLIVSLIPGDIAVASNILTLIVGGVVWPITLTYLASVVFPRNRGVWLLTPILATSYISFPYAQLVRSGQWPNGLGTALIPAALAILIVVLRLFFTRNSDRQDANTPRIRQVITTASVCAMVLGGTAAAHPGALMFVAVAATPFAAACCIPWLSGTFRQHPKRGVVALLAGLGVVAATIAVLSQSRILTGVMRYDRSVRAELPESIPFALFDLATFPVLQAPDLDEFNLYAGVLAIVGALTCLIRREHVALPVAWILFVLLHILAAGPENPARWMTGFWYKDTQRIAPMIAMTGVLLAAWTLNQLAHAAAGAVRRVVAGGGARVPRGRPGCVPAAIALLLMTAMYLASDNFRAAERIAVTALNYSVDADGMGVLAAGEQRFIEKASRLLPDDAVVIGDPFNGETYFYALGQRRVVYTQLGSATSGSETKNYLRMAFNRIHTDPSVCRALHLLGVTHFYEDEPTISHASDSLANWPGFYGTDTDRGFEVVIGLGPHTLYRITAC